MNKYQEEYELYMKKVVDRFTKIQSIQFDFYLTNIEDDLMDIGTLLIFKVKELRHTHRLENLNIIINDFNEYKYNIALKYLNDNIMTHSQFLNKFYPNE